MQSTWQQVEIMIDKQISDTLNKRKKYTKPSNLVVIWMRDILAFVNHFLSVI